jgi:hypothetical protein
MFIRQQCLDFNALHDINDDFDDQETFCNHEHRKLKLYENDWVSTTRDLFYSFCSC